MGLDRFVPDCNSPVLRWGGHALLICALVYCIAAIARLGMDDVLGSLSGGAWAIALALGVAYGGALCLLAIGWGGMAPGQREGAKGDRVEDTGGAAARLSFTERLAIYGPGVIAKYIPGSVFQYGSRQLIGARFGLAQKGMARASLIEAGLHVPAALISASALALGGGAPALAGIAVLGAVLIAVGPGAFVRAAGCQLVFFSLFALFAALVAGAALGAESPFALAGLFMLAWVAGFLVPVAPGGLGVRESVLLALSAQVEPSGALIAAFALLTRFATSIGDAAFGLAGYGLMLSRRENRQASS